MTASITTGSMRRPGQVVLEGMEPVVILAALITIPLTVVEVNGQNGDAYQVADWAVWAIFLAECELTIGASYRQHRAAEAGANGRARSPPHYRVVSVSHCSRSKHPSPCKMM